MKRKRKSATPPATPMAVSSSLNPCTAFSVPPPVTPTAASSPSNPGAAPGAAPPPPTVHGDLVLFPTLSKQLHVIADRDLIAFPAPLAVPPFIECIEDTSSRARSLELWNASLRLDVALMIVSQFYAMFEFGGTISPTAQEMVTRLLPELASLKDFFDRVFLWPSRSCPNAIPPMGEAHPVAELQAITHAIRTVIARDAELLERAGAIKKVRQHDGRSAWRGISFEVDPEEEASGRLARSPIALRIGNPWEPELDLPLLGEVRSFRERMNVAPTQTCASVSPPIEIVSRLCTTEGSPRNFEIQHGSSSGVAEIDTRCKPAKRHSEDFASVHWFGSDHVFNPTQAAIVRILWEAWESGTPTLTQETLLKAADCEDSEIRNLFKKHSAWRTMIIRTPGKRGLYQLNAPNPANGLPGTAKYPRKTR